jgi:hypothetical protein
VNTCDIYVVYIDDGKSRLSQPEGNYIFTNEGDAYEYIDMRIKGDRSLNLLVSTLKDYLEKFEERLDDIAQDAAWERE